MKTKILSLLSFSIFSLVLLASFASATITFSNYPTTLSQSSSSFTINVSTDKNETISFSSSTITEGSDTITFTPENSSLIFNESNGYSSTITVNYNTDNFNFKFGTEYITTFTANGNESGNKTQSISFEKTPFYDGNRTNDLEVSDIEIDVTKGFGDDEDFWYPFDEIEVTFNVDNNGQYDVEDIEIQVCLLDEKTDKCIMDEDDMDISNDKFDLDEGDDKDITLNFKIDADDLDQGNNDYTLYIKAIGELTGSDAKDDNVDGKETGDYDSQSNIEIRTDDNFMILDDFEFNGMTLDDMKLVDEVACGSELQVTADLWNIADDDEDDVTVLIRNTELGINEKILIDNIGDFDSEKIEKTIKIPQNAEEKEYSIDFLVYDEDNDLFENDEDDSSIFHVTITVNGNCEISEKTASVSASLISEEARAGNELTVKATIKNTGDKTSTYILNVADYADWATFNELDSNSLTLVAGESRDVTLTFNVKDDVEGTKKFNLEVVEGSTVTKQPVTVTIEPQKSLFGFTLPQNNLYLWIIGAVNVILILAIIVVAIRLSRD